MHHFFGNKGRMLALLRSAVADERSAAWLRDFLSRAVLRPLPSASDAADANLRAALTGSRLVGLAIARYVVPLEPLASTSADVLARALGRTVDRYLNGGLE